ncbi:DEAD/DEAH box helicase [Aquidulcibacter paucihalophilus]|nr:DEAD/DEAH box helicase [Aquidulcibacter paucihalophilus]
MTQASIFQTLDDLRQRTTEAVIGQSGLNHPGLSAEIRRRFGSSDPLHGGVMQQPVIEAAPSYAEADETMAELAGSLLHQATVDALDGGSDDRPNRYRFRAEWRPYEHQISAWRKLSDPSSPQSVLVTSGTGSGKTECFLVPIIDDLARQSAGSGLEGVQAVILYPLNALIASQEERLRDWTAPFKGRLRFCLYNGLLPEELPSHQRQGRPEAVRDRKSLRESPPPILVTNVTMLEYMLLRKEDAPILAKSQGKLRYIVLDEAHSYVGAQAAEIALLLRRVCLGFGVSPTDVRFIATSATIGGTDAQVQLQRFLADVAGVALEQVTVIEGRQKWPELPSISDTGHLASAFDDPTAEGAFDTLASSANIRPLLNQLRKGPVPWPSVEGVAEAVGVSPDVLLHAISTARRDDEGLSPLRVHAFHRAIPGIWTCLNNACRRPIPADWPFGSISTEDVERCVCGSPTFDIVLCNACGEPYVDVAERGDGALVRATRAVVSDEYALDADSADGANDDREGDDEGDLEGATVSSNFHHRLVCRPLSQARSLHVDVQSSKAYDSAGEGRVSFQRVDGEDCRCCQVCHASRKNGPDLIRPLRFGAPFILQNATPVLLDSAASAADETTAKSVPMGGRQLLSFTDSRQGTARFSAKLQVGAERNFVRSFVYHAMQAVLGHRPDTTELDVEIEQLRGPAASMPQLQGLLAKLEAQRAAALSGSSAGLGWQELVSALSKRPEVQRWLGELWSRRDRRFENPEALAHFLLLREFFRRPRRAISIETLGLARLSFAEVDAIPDVRVPTSFTTFGGSGADWRDYLNIILTYLVRENAAVNVPWNDRHWIQPSVFSAEYVKGADAKTESWHKLWPSIRQGDRALGPLSRPVILLAQGLGVPLDDVEARAAVQECLDQAWMQTAGVMATVGSNGRQLEFTKARITPVTAAYICPITRRVLDTSFRGLTPYGAESRHAPPRSAAKVVLPVHPHPFLGMGEQADPETARELIADWLNTDPGIAELRLSGAWSDISDRVALFADYFRSAEHSAQQPPHRLREYEAEFKRGEINVLNCSTTMEMGVDIGSVSHVMMTNVPPSLASYRQRIGRAGRRRQAVSLGFTFCKNRPLDRAAFSDPIGFLQRTVAAPRVALDSTVIVQRHVNALLFSVFIKNQAGNALKMQAGGFFGCTSAAGAQEDINNPAKQLADFAEQSSTREAYAPHVAKLVRGSVLENDAEVFDRAAAEIRRIRAAFRDEWAALQSVRALGGADDTAINRGLAIQLKRMCDDYLLSVLSGRGFLPGHGFPTGVVSFVCRGDGPKDAGAERARFNSYPQRQLDVAIREYAPGSAVVIDGLVHQSAGVTLNWRRPASADGIREIQNLLWRWRCGSCGESGTSRSREQTDCPACLAPSLRWTEYLEPAGFAADLMSEPHADPDLVSHVPAEPPAVTIQDTEWTSLIDPAFGRLRSSRHGRVFFCNTGPARKGYKLCLYCGRAEPGANASDAVPEVDDGVVWRHRPLLAKADVAGDCPGSLKPFSVKPSLRLGYEISTDVFELQVSGIEQSGAGLALVIALRETLARRLGVEPEEMGFAVEPRVGAFGRRFSLFLFDKSAGGAGFAVQAADMIPELLRDCARLLDCAVPGCQNGCPACVLVGDLNDTEALSLDRQSALQVVRKLADNTAPQPADMAAPNARLIANMFDAIDRSVVNGAHTVRLRLEGPLDLGELTQWSAAKSSRRWAGLKRAVVVSIGRDDLASLDGASRLALRDRLHEWGARLEEGDGVELANGARVLAEAESETEVLVIATRDADAAVGGAGWGRVNESPLVAYTTETSLVGGDPVGLDRLQPSPSALVKAIDGELDGDLARFGKKFAAELQQLLAKAGTPDQRIIELSYSDRYLNSPLVVRMALDCFKELCRPTPGEPVPVTLHLQNLKPSDRSMRAVWDDWKKGDDRLDVISLFGRRIGLAVTSREGALRHGRILELTYANGAKASVLLDQGFGAWGASGSQASFDFHAAPAQQTNALGMTNVVLKSRPGGTYVVAQLGHV